MRHVRSHKTRHPVRRCDRRCDRRYGAVAVWAIACMVLVTVLGATMVQVALRGSRQVRQERRYSQTEWLADAGWQLALVNLQRDRAYTGQVWELSAADAGGPEAGRVTIQVAAEDGDAAEPTRRVTVITELSPNETQAIRITRSGRVPLPGAAEVRSATPPESSPETTPPTTTTPPETNPAPSTTTPSATEPSMTVPDPPPLPQDVSETPVDVLPVENVRPPADVSDEAAPESVSP